MVVTRRWWASLVVLAVAVLSAVIGIVITLQDGPQLCSYPALCRLRPDGSCAPNPPCPASGYHWWWVVTAACSGAVVVGLAVLIWWRHGEQARRCRPTCRSEGAVLAHEDRRGDMALRVFPGAARAEQLAA